MQTYFVRRILSLAIISFMALSLPTAQATVFEDLPEKWEIIKDPKPKRCVVYFLWSETVMVNVLIKYDGISIYRDCMTGIQFAKIKSFKNRAQREGRYLRYDSTENITERFSLGEKFSH